MAKALVGTLALSGAADGAATLTWDASLGGGTAAGTLAVEPGGNLYFIPTSAGDKTLMQTNSDTVGRETAGGGETA